MLYVSRVRARNFRLLKDVTIPLRQHCVIVGENNVGKTTLLELLDRVLSPTSRGIQVLDQDFHYSADPRTDAIEVEVELRPTSGGKFVDRIRQAFYPHVDVEPGGRERLVIRVEVRYDPDQEGLRPVARFVKGDGKPDDGSFLPFRRHIPFFMIDSIRDVRRELGSRQGLWSRLARTRTLESEKQEAIRKLGEEVGRRLLELALGDAAFKDLVDDFTSFLRTVLWPAEQSGSFEFSVVPEDFQDFLQAIELRLQNPGEDRPLAVHSHGAGTSSLIVFALFFAYIKALGYDAPILAVEEPEAHLHPHAQRALARQVVAGSTQSIITTHTTFVTDLAKPSQIVLLKRRGNQTEARYVPDGYFDPAEEETLARYIRGTTSEFYFARCVLLVEGASDRVALPAFARARGIDFDRLGISVVEASGANFRHFLKLFDRRALDIPWTILCDNDDAIVKCLRHAVELGLLPGPDAVPDVESRRADLEALGVFFYPTRGDFERFLLGQGFVQEYEEAIAEVHGTGVLDAWIVQTAKNQPQIQTYSRAGQIDAFISSRRGGRKPELAAMVAARITRDESDPSRIPEYFCRVIDRVVSVAMKEIVRTSGDPASQP